MVFSTSLRLSRRIMRYIEQLQKYDVDYGKALEDEQSDTRSA